MGVEKRSVKFSVEFLDFLDSKIIHKSETYEGIIKRLLNWQGLENEI